MIPPAEHIGKHAVLLSGPGTSKTTTLTARTVALLLEHQKNPDEILVLTFTRAAVYKLRKEIEVVLKPLGFASPRISTLHSFALRQLLRNSSKISSLPNPLRIADDWEERNIIWENLKGDLSKPIKKIEDLFNLLSADWETLRIEEGIEQRFCQDANFIGAWNSQRDMFGYTLRSELVYRLKKALEQIPDFSLESNFKYIMVDEYQDLNPCDLAVIEELSKSNCELFVAGDDDQSIYGFRYAYPIGIRTFTDKYSAKKFTLETCRRCDNSIIVIGEFVANLDYQRLPKRIKPREGAGPGEVHLWCPKDQLEEAKWIALKCKQLLANEPKNTILIIMRSDYLNRISKPIVEAFNQEGLPVVVKTEESILDSVDGRKILSILRLVIEPKDNLAWYTLLFFAPGIGIKTISPLIHLAKEKGYRLVDAIEEITLNPSMTPSQKLLAKIENIKQFLQKYKNTTNPFQDIIRGVVEFLVPDPDNRQRFNEYFNQLISETNANSLSELLTSISTSLGDKEQELKEGVINIMTMHKAKGLESDVVFIVGAEKQFIPGKNIGLKAEDERRLLYVSLTRAKHLLFITFCQKRIGQQKYTGSESGNPRRELTPFLKDSFLKGEFNPL